MHTTDRDAETGTKMFPRDAERESVELAVVIREVLIVKRDTVLIAEIPGGYNGISAI